MRTSTRVGLLAALFLTAAACGGDDGGSAADSAPPVTAPPTASPTIAAADGTDAPTTTALPAPDTTDDADAPADVPSRIVSLSPTHTEMLFAIGAGDQVIAVDDFSNYPPDAAAVMTELSAFEPNVEAIAGFEPDLVVVEGTNPALLDQLDALGITWWAGPAAVTFDDVFIQLEQLGAATGNVAGAVAVVAEMQTEIEAITASLPEVDRPLTYYHELDPTYFSITSDTFIGYVYTQLGLRSIGDLAEGSGGAYPQLNAEFILSTDPDLIFQACTKYCGESGATMAARPGWDSLSAVRNDLVFEMDDDVASRWGPRIVDYFAQVADAIRRAVELQPTG